MTTFSKLSSYDTPQYTADRVGYATHPKAGKPKYSERQIAAVSENFDRKRPHYVAGAAAVGAGSGGILGAMTPHKVVRSRAVRGGLGAAAGGAALGGLAVAARRQAISRARTYARNERNPEQVQVWERTDKATGRKSHYDWEDKPFKGSYKRFQGQSGERSAVAKALFNPERSFGWVPGSKRHFADYRAMHAAREALDADPQSEHLVNAAWSAERKAHKSGNRRVAGGAGLVVAPPLAAGTAYGVHRSRKRRGQVKKSGMVRVRQKSNRTEQAAGAALVLAGTSRVRGIGKLVETGTRSKNALTSDASKAVRHVHRHAGHGYDVGHKAISSTKYGEAGLNYTGKYTPHATAFIGTGLIGHGRKRETIQGW